MIPKPPRKFHVEVPTGLLAESSSSDTRRMAVHDWGDITNQNVLVCVHGLSRNGRDFDVIANALSDRYRVLCPDVVGRGESDWYATSAEYAIPNYAAAMQKMLSDLAVKEYDWLGTSMGGLIGMVMCSLPQSGLRKFVINDVGPEIERSALERIAMYMSARPRTFPDYMSLFHAAQPAIAPFGPLTDEQKHHIIGTSCRRREDGQWEFNTDPKIGEAFVATLKSPPVDLWPLWSSIQQKTLILRGQGSDLLSESTLNKMLDSPQSKSAITIEATGHAPMLMDDETIAAIREFLLT